MKYSSKEIAARAGVSQATVSRVINNRPNVSPETRRRVKEVIEEVGYVPNAEARNLVTQKTNKIGLVVSDIANPFYPELIESVERIAWKSGHSVLLCNTQRDSSKENLYTRFLAEQRVAGVLFTSISSDSNAPSWLEKADIPFVFLGRYVRDTEAPCVLTDNSAGAYAMTEYLIQLGHRQIAFVRGLKDTTTSQDREAGYRCGLEAYGLESIPSHLEQGYYTREGAYHASIRLLRQGQPPTAIFCANDYMAFGAIDAASELSYHVPRDLSIVGFDNIKLSSMQAINLTTVQQPIIDMANQSMAMLLALVRDRRASMPKVRVYKPTLVIRGTSGPVPSPNIDVDATNHPALSEHTRLAQI